MRKRLKEVCDFYSGTGFPVKFQGEEDGDLPFYKVGDIANNALAGNVSLSFCNNYISYDIAKEIKGTIIPANVVVFAKIGEALKLNRRAITSCNCLIDNNAMGIAGKEEVLIPQYFYFFMKNLKMESLAESTTVPSVRKSKLEEVEIEIPDLIEQSSVIDILGTLQIIISQRQNQLTQMDNLIKARFVELFGDLADPACKWEKCKLVDACAKPDDIKCGPFGTQLGKGEYTERGVAVWEIPQINAEFKTLPTHFVTEEKADELDAYSIKPGDIAMSRKGNVGRCAVFPDTFDNGIIHSDVLRIRVDNSKVLPEFMMRQLHYSGDVQHQIELVSSGAIMAGINVTKLKQIYVYLPPIDMQREFVSFIARTGKAESAVQKALDEVQLLFDSLMQEYFG